MKDYGTGTTVFDLVYPDFALILPAKHGIFYLSHFFRQTLANVKLN